MSTGTTLEQQLLRAAERADFAAIECTPQAVGVRWKRLRGIHEAEAREARQRVAWVRRHLAAVETAGDIPGSYLNAVRDVIRDLTGPIPSETAWAAPCVTCKGAREVLHVYARGPGDPPGNQMIPCPTCRPAAPREGTVKLGTCPEWCAKGKCELTAGHEGDFHQTRRGDYVWSVRVGGATAGEAKPRECFADCALDAGHAGKCRP